MDIPQAISLARDKVHSFFHAEYLSDFFYFYPFKIGHRTHYARTEVQTISLTETCFKTLAEDDISPYDFFTELLRYRMRDLRLGDSMLVYLSQG